MHILIATTGALSPGPVADFAAKLVGEAGRISVVTVIEVPRTFLDTIRSDQWNPLGESSPDWQTREDAVIARYVEERGRRITDPVLSALAARGLSAESRYLEGEDPARSIVAAVKDLDADMVILGATRKIFDESAWESVSARVMAESQRPVLVVPARDRADVVPSDDDYPRPGADD